MLLLLLAAASAAAAQAPVSLSLSDAVSRALSSHPSLIAGVSRIQASEGISRQAGLRPNPRLSLQTENIRTWGNPGFHFPSQTDTFAFVTQRIETASKRDHRVELSGAGIRAAQAERDVLGQQITGRVKNAYWLATGAQSSRDVILETIASFDQVVAYHQARVREGAMAEVDLIRVQIERDRLSLAANNASIEAERARIALFREMGASEFPEVVFTEDLNPGGPPAIMAADPQTALERRAEAALARVVLDRSRAAVTLERAIARPDVETAFGYKRSAGFDTLMGGFYLDLPFSNRNQGNIAAAAATVRAAESSLAATEALIRAEVAAARRDLEIRRRQFEESFRTLRDRAAESARIARAAYQQGGIDLLRLLDAERVQLETRLLYTRALAEYRQSIAALETAMGVTQ